VCDRTMRHEHFPLYRHKRAYDIQICKKFRITYVLFTREYKYIYIWTKALIERNIHLRRINIFVNIYKNGVHTD